MDETMLRHARHRVNGVELAAVEAGPHDGPLAILLHGFPDFWWGWRHQIGPLAAAGYRVLVPDQRGYNTSSKPFGISQYRLDALVGDVVGLADALGHERFRLVGHDWGGIVAWGTALRHPGRVERLAVIDAPHPQVWSTVALRHPTQALRSTYVALFQLPFFPEMLLRAGGFAALSRALSGSARPGMFSPDDLERYRRAWSQPRALTAMLNWYRALRFPAPGLPSRVRPPALVIWGGRDSFLEPAMFRASLALCDRGESLFLEHATHWVHLEEAATVNAALRRFLGPA
ncbi:alpha/beta fold hydrolase [Roseomonas sp. BN140053]|uniref:alpha/beta fold hydrolase n=1 Tax=Roseomonas sp. BN140053 TaxID=3391898 RepID=UPI0039EB5865